MCAQPEKLQDPESSLAFFSTDSARESPSDLSFDPGPDREAFASDALPAASEPPLADVASPPARSPTLPAETESLDARL